MPLPVIANTYRCTFNWTNYLGVAPRNVIHVQGTAVSVTDVAEAVVNALQTHQFEGMNGSFVLHSLDALPLDGTSASASVPGGGYSSGTSPSGEFSPASAIVVSLRTGVRGPRGRGRVYIGPVNEGIMADGQIPGANATEITAAWDAFRAALLAGTPALSLVVASYTHADANVVGSNICETVLGTQRRRQDQLRR